jgi:peroxisomal coenzyme A diphosphatase NUDT7
MPRQFREAYEEVGLPLNCPDIHTVALLEPFISLHRLIVTPVVAVLTRPPVLDNLQAAQAEVACIFTHPLEAILDPALAQSEPLVALGSEDWPYDTELYVCSDYIPFCSELTISLVQNTSDSVVSVLNSTVYRMHRFRSSASSIKGLTADILVRDILYL